MSEIGSFGTGTANESSEAIVLGAAMALLATIFVGSYLDALSVAVLQANVNRHDVGSITVEVTGTDAAGASVSNSFDITVNNTNDAPTVTQIADTSVNEDASLNYDVSGNFADVDRLSAFQPG